MTTTLLFLLLGAVAYLGGLAVEPGLPRVVMQSVGGFLLGTVVVGYSYQFFLGEETENRTTAKLESILRERLDAVFPAAARYGFNGFATGGVPRRLFAKLGRGDELLWLDTYSPDLMVFVSDLRNALAAGATLRMLVIDPDAATAAMRAREITSPGYDESRFLSNTADFLAELLLIADEMREAPGRLEVRCYGDLPCVPMYLELSQGRLMRGTTGYFLVTPSFDDVHLCWNNVAGGMLERFQVYFEYKWTHARAPR